MRAIDSEMWLYVAVSGECLCLFKRKSIGVDLANRGISKCLCRRLSAPEHDWAWDLESATLSGQFLQGWCIATTPISHLVSVIIFRLSILFSRKMNLCFSILSISIRPATLLAPWSSSSRDSLMIFFAFCGGRASGWFRLLPSRELTWFAHDAFSHTGFLSLDRWVREPIGEVKAHLPPSG